MMSRIFFTFLFWVGINLVRADQSDPAQRVLASGPSTKQVPGHGDYEQGLDVCQNVINCEIYLDKRAGMYLARHKPGMEPGSQWYTENVDPYDVLVLDERSEEQKRKDFEEYIIALDNEDWGIVAAADNRSMGMIIDPNMVVDPTYTPIHKSRSTASREVAQSVRQAADMDERSNASTNENNSNQGPEVETSVFQDPTGATGNEDESARQDQENETDTGTVNQSPGDSENGGPPPAVNLESGPSSDSSGGNMQPVTGPSSSQQYDSAGGSTQSRQNLASDGNPGKLSVKAKSVPGASGTTNKAKEKPHPNNSPIAGTSLHTEMQSYVHFWPLHATERIPFGNRSPAKTIGLVYDLCTADNNCEVASYKLATSFVHDGTRHKGTLNLYAVGSFSQNATSPAQKHYLIQAAAWMLAKTTTTDSTVKYHYCPPSVTPPETSDPPACTTMHLRDQATAARAVAIRRQVWIPTLEKWALAGHFAATMKMVTDEGSQAGELTCPTVMNWLGFKVGSVPKVGPFKSGFAGTVAGRACD